MFGNYLKTALRNIFKQKVYSFINIAGLAIGMACCLLILLYVHYELSYDTYHKKHDRIFRLTDSGVFSGRTINMAAIPARWAPAILDDFPVVEKYVRIKPPMSRWLVRYRDVVFYEKGFVFADSTVFDVFDFKLVRGNPETVLKEPNTVVMTEEMAVKYFGNDDPIGKVLLLDNDYNFRVTGILEKIPPNSHFRFDFLASFSTLYRHEIYGGIDNWMNHFIYTYLLLKPGVSPETMENNMHIFADKYIGNIIRSAGAKIDFVLQPITGIHLQSHLENEIESNSDMKYIYILSSIAFLVLLVACVNFMNLSTARSAKRAKEVGLRKVAGAYRNQLIIQFIGEALILTLAALIIAMILVIFSIPFFNNLIGKPLNFNPIANMDIASGIIFMVLFVGVLIGSYPAFFLSAFQPANVLKGTFSTGVKGSLLRKILVVVQFTVSIILIIGTVTIYNQLSFIKNKELGFDKKQVIVIPLPDYHVRATVESFKSALQRNTSVINVGSASSVPGELYGQSIIVPEGFAANESVIINTMKVTIDYIETLNIKIAEGRSYSREFPADTTGAVLVNETAVEKFGWEKPIGKEIGFPGTNFRMRVIGVVKDYHFKSLHQLIEPLLITPFGSDLLFTVIKIKPQNIQGTISYIKETWRRVNSNHLMEYSFLDRDYDNLYKDENRLGQIFGYFAILSIFIACLGLLGISSYTAEQKTKEIGIRKVLGASEFSINNLLTKEFFKLVLIANLFAFPAAYYVMNKWIQNFAYRTNINIFSFIFAGIITVIITILTVSFQTVRAARANPVDSLKYE